ncbi:MAG: formyl-CoA transferase [Pseudomonadota bacterium]
MAKLSSKAKPKGKPKAKPARTAAPARRPDRWAHLPKPTARPFGRAGQALDGIRVLDLSHVQAGPSAMQIMAWLGADVIKVELPGRGDITRGQLRDLPDVDSLYFTMLNCNKRGITIDMKSEKGREILTRLLKICDVVMENFGPGAMDRLGLTWEAMRKLNPRLIYASIKGFGAGPYADCKAYENVAQCMGGAASTTGYEDGPPTIAGAQLGDSGTGIHALAAILAALIQRARTGRGQRIEMAMQDCVLNLARVKMRDQQRLAHGPLREYPNRSFGEAVPRAGNASGGGQPGNALKCKGGGPNDYIYVIIQPPVWAPLAKLIGRPELVDDPRFATPEARLPRLDEVWQIVEAWTRNFTKFEVMAKLNEVDVPCGPVLSMKDLLEDESLRARGVVVDVQHPTRGTFKTVGCPLHLSDSPVEVKAPPLLGEHNEAVLTGLLGYAPADVEAFRRDGVI